MSRNKCAGDFDYDGFLDVIYHRANPELEYGITLDFGNVLIDLSKDQNIKRIEIINASKILGVSTYDLKHIICIMGSLNIGNNKIKLTLKVKFLKRNRNTTVSFESDILNDYGLSETTINVSAGPALA
ncbi:hypothetical protein [Methanococcus sp. CF]